MVQRRLITVKLLSGFQRTLEKRTLWVKMPLWRVPEECLFKYRVCLIIIHTSYGWFQCQKPLKLPFPGEFTWKYSIFCTFTTYSGWLRYWNLYFWRIYLFKPFSPWTGGTWPFPDLPGLLFWGIRILCQAWLCLTEDNKKGKPGWR